MADLKISQLPEATTTSDTDEFPVVQGGVTKRVDKTVLLDGANATGVVYTSGAGLTATDVAAALDELATEKVDTSALTDLTAGYGLTLTGAEFSASIVNSTKTASYTLANADKGTTILMNVAGACDVTINASLDLAVGQRIDVVQIGAGQVTFVNSGATVNSTPGLKIRARYGAATVLCVGTDSYVVIGDLAA
jgi:hypothetical protein